MNRTQLVRYLAVAATLLCVITSTGLAQQSGKKQFAFRGKVERIDTANKALIVNGEKVEGWMGAMTMAYHVDKPEALNKVKVGDTITAKVYDGDYMTLYDIQVVPPAKK